MDRLIPMGAAPMDENTGSFGYWIKRRRKALDLTRAGLAARVNCSSDTIKKIERDERRPSLQIAGLLADALELAPEEREQFLSTAEKKRSPENLPLSAKSYLPSPRLPYILPFQATPFIGRQTELAGLTSRLNDPECRLVTLTGPGGIGKTRLALQVAEHLQADYRDGACFTALAEIDSPGDMPAAITTSLGLTQLGRNGSQEQLISFLQNKELLLLLDNYEHLLPHTRLLAAILQQAPRVKLLVTSRQRLNLISEWVYALEGLSFPTKEVTDLETYGSAALFVGTARRLKPDFMLDESNRSAVAQICRQVEGMPLGIELAAAWIPALDPQEITRQLESGLDLLEADFGDLPERQRSMRAVFEGSWKLLSEHEQHTVQQLAVFRGGFTQGAAEMAFGIPVRQILWLVNKCWLRSESNGRFGMHELVRQYAYEKLQLASDFMHNIEERHSTYFFGVLSKHEKNWFTARESEALREIDLEYPNINEAWIWALKQQRLDLVVRGSESLACYYGQYLRFEERDAAMESVLQCMDYIQNKQGKESNTVLLARARAMIALVGRLATRIEIRKEFAKVRVLLDQLEKDGCETRPERARILSWEGHLKMSEDTQEAFEFYHQAAALYREMGNDLLVAEVFYSIGENYERLGEFHQAFHYINQGLQIGNQTGYPRLLADCHMLLGKLNRHKGKVEEAERFGRSSLEEYRKQGLRCDDGFALLHLCYTLMIAGKFPEALLRAKNSLKVFDWLSTGPDHQGASQIMIALIMLHQGQYEQVEQLIKYSLGNMHNIQDSRVKGLIFTTSGAFLLVKQQEEQAVEHFQMSLQIYQKSNQVNMAGIPKAYLAYAFLALNQLSVAEQYLMQCMKDAVQIGSYLFAIQALPALALLETAQGKHERAIEIYSQSLKFPYVANSKWFRDVFGVQIDLLAEQLPTEVVSAARSRGRKMELWEVVKNWLKEKHLNR
jgi:transcriptional regulator with XRE-family HTH domain/tetratricopeptide (TPR) repeat protein